jgi:chromatin remodeling complex protein RSC6
MSSNSSSDVSNKMVSKTTTKKTAAAAAPVEAAPVAAAPAKATKATKKAEAAPSNPNPAPVVVAPVVVPVSASPAPVAPVAEEDPAAALQTSITALHEQLASLKSAASTAAAALKVIEKQVARVAKKADRKRKRRSESASGAGAAAKPCIFTKPVKVSDELCAFLAKPKGTEISRADVTKAISAYASAHNLKDKQTIKADAALRKLLKLGESDVLTIMNLQRYLRDHYVKPAPVAV